MPLTSDPEASTRLLVECMHRMEQTVPRKSIEGIGISLPGRVDPATQKLTFAPNLHWPDFDIKKVMEEKMSLPVKMENAATAGLLAELTFARMDGTRDAVLVTISESISPNCSTLPKKAIRTPPRLSRNRPPGSAVGCA